jgi:hypothetical protein
MTQGFEMIELIIDVQNCLEVTPSVHDLSFNLYIPLFSSLH